MRNPTERPLKVPSRPSLSGGPSQYLRAGSACGPPLSVGSSLHHQGPLVSVAFTTTSSLGTVHKSHSAVSGFPQLVSTGGKLKSQCVCPAYTDTREASWSGCIPRDKRGHGIHYFKFCQVHLAGAESDVGTTAPVTAANRECPRRSWHRGSNDHARRLEWLCTSSAHPPVVESTDGMKCQTAPFDAFAIGGPGTVAAGKT